MENVNCLRCRFRHEDNGNYISPEEMKNRWAYYFDRRAGEENKHEAD